MLCHCSGTPCPGPVHLFSRQSRALPGNPGARELTPGRVLSLSMARETIPLCSGLGSIGTDILHDA